jgi:hypothetical protein
MHQEGKGAQTSYSAGPTLTALEGIGRIWGRKTTTVFVEDPNLSLTNLARKSVLGVNLGERERIFLWL